MVYLIGLWFMLATIALNVSYVNLLALSYAEGDLSLVYPVARGMGPMIVPVLAVVVSSETMEPLAIGGIAAIAPSLEGYTQSHGGAIFIKCCEDPYCSSVQPECVTQYSPG